MNLPAYLLDFKNITNPDGIIKSLSDWTIDQLSERTFEIFGREYTKKDLLNFYQCIGKDGHIFIYDYESGVEYYRPKHPKNRRKFEAKDSDLDVLTVQRILSYLDDRQD